ncbi:MAG: nucleotidyl transferase AbiEii/AbiGii toxin family protein [Aestuariivita sp.]|nr:nucleotidyl transferase AbiEii/AbiGii toxin family protein [Aestuariivita sp.]MCY4202610.1 nucleotidyl transferase AbiEii/AbiGii toxin family protein [Aestuariivita sp.]
MEWIAAKPFQILTDRIRKFGLKAKVSLNNDKIILEYEEVSRGAEYVLPEVLLEFGARSTGEPADRHKITCDISDSAKDLRLPIANPRVMRAERTFWEKATAIHVYCLRGAFRGGWRYARHWYDLDCLDHTNIAKKAISDRALASDVAKHKQHFFREKDKANNVIDYQAAVSGALCLVPSGQALDALADDYQQMFDAGLLGSANIGFETLMQRLSNLQDRINAGLKQ